MQIFIDTANLEHIKKAAETGLVDGVTTNPTLIAKEGKDFEEVINEIIKIVPGPVSAEVISLNAEGMIKEAEELSKIAPNVVIKIPMTMEGMRAVKHLSKKGIKTNVTLVFSENQALLAAKAGATYISVFMGRLDDRGGASEKVISNIRNILDTYNFSSKIIAASIRHPRHVFEAAIAGAHVATIPYGVFTNLFDHPLTSEGIDKFLKDWEGFQKKLK
ncbi:MAG: transaldolase [Thermosediminibacterales bacterium]|nr:transaldolase [Thermosediminibacterales bacterium]